MYKRQAQVRVYDRLFTEANPGAADDFVALINPDSLNTFTNAKLEPSILDASKEDRFQFERVGYFCFDQDSSDQQVIMNRTVSLRDTWAKKGA